MWIRGLLASFALVVLSSAATAQTWSPEQQEIWRFEEKQWNMAKENGRWVFLSWAGGDYPEN